MRSRAAVGPVVAGCVLLTWAGTAPAEAAPEHRAVTPYAVSGTPVRGSTTGCDDAPALGPGRYVDGLQKGKDLWYRVDKRPEQVLELSATALPPDLVYGSSHIKIGAGWAEGDDPSSWLSDVGTMYGGRASVGARSNQKGDGQRSACVHITNVLSPMGSQADAIPVEVVVGFGDSPEPGRTSDGFSFSGARQVPADGHVSGDLALGEFPFWRVEVKDGQTLTVQTTMQHPASLSAGPLARWTVAIYDPLRSVTRCPAQTGDRSEVFVKAGSGSTQLTCGPWKVDTDLKSFETEFAIPGTYYIVPGVIGESDFGHGQVVPYEMTVSVAGTGTDRDPGAVAGSGGSTGTGKGKEASASTGSGNGSGSGTGAGDNSPSGPGDERNTPGSDAAPAGSAADDNGTTSTALAAAAGAAALASVGAFGMHLRRRRLDTGFAPAGMAARSAAAPPFPAPPSQPPAKPGAAPAPPDHNALDSVWSMSAIPAWTDTPTGGNGNGTGSGPGERESHPADAVAESPADAGAFGNAAPDRATAAGLGAAGPGRAGSERDDWAEPVPETTADHPAVPADAVPPGSEALGPGMPGTGTAWPEAGAEPHGPRSTEAAAAPEDPPAPHGPDGPETTEAPDGPGAWEAPDAGPVVGPASAPPQVLSRSAGSPDPSTASDEHDSVPPTFADDAVVFTPPPALFGLPDESGPGAAPGTGPVADPGAGSEPGPAADPGAEEHQPTPSWRPPGRTDASGDGN